MDVEVVKNGGDEFKLGKERAGPPSMHIRFVGDSAGGLAATPPQE
jgi:hypothetical protein